MNKWKKTLAILTMVVLASLLMASLSPALAQSEVLISEQTSISAGSLTAIVDVHPSSNARSAVGAIITIVGTTNFDITRISLSLAKLGAPTVNLELCIYSTDGQIPVGSPLYTSAIINSASLQVTASWVDFVFSPNAVSTSGTQYAFSLQAISGSGLIDSSDYVKVFGTFGTNDLFSYNAGSWSHASGSPSLAYQLYGIQDNNLVPTPYQTPSPTPYNGGSNPTSTPTSYYGNPTPTPSPYQFPTSTPPPTYILGYGFSSTDLLVILLAIVSIMVCGVYVAHSLNSSGKSRKRHK